MYPSWTFAQPLKGLYVSYVIVSDVINSSGRASLGLLHGPAQMHTHKERALIHTAGIAAEIRHKP